MLTVNQQVIELSWSSSRRVDGGGIYNACDVGTLGVVLSC